MPMPAARLLAFTLTATLATDRLYACDSSACAAAMRYADGTSHKGEWRLDVSVRHVDDSRRLLGSGATPVVERPRVDLRSPRPILAPAYETASAMSLLQADVSYSVMDRLVVYGSLPLYRRTTIEHDPSPAHVGIGHPAAVDGTPVHGREAKGGVGDLQVGVRQLLWSRPAHEWFVTAIVKAPTGRVGLRSWDGAVDPMMQPGTGAFDFTGSLLVNARVGRVPLSGSLALQKRTTSADSYRFGDEIVAALGGHRRLCSRVTATLQAKVQRAGRHRFHDAPLPSTGFTLVQLAPGVRFRLSPGLVTYAAVQCPAYARVNESQLAPRLAVTAGFVKAF